MPIEIKELHIKAAVGGKEKIAPPAQFKTEEINKLKKEARKAKMELKSRRSQARREKQRSRTTRLRYYLRKRKKSMKK